MRYKKIKVGGVTKNLHRYIMECHVGHELGPDVVVHHINEDTLDNRIENLQILTWQQHAELHNQKHAITKVCEHCGTAFTPHPTKRERAKTCSEACRRAQTADKRRTLAPDGTRVCKTCARQLPWTPEHFHRAGDSLMTRCKPCNVEHARRHRARALFDLP